MAAEATRRKAGPGFLVNGYLMVYNGMLTAGWALLLMKTVQYMTSNWQSLKETGGGSVPRYYQEIRLPLLIFQTLALLEVFHAVIGIVSSAVMTTLMQVSSRIFVTWALMEGVPGASESVGSLLTVFAWSLTEVIRYAYYFFSLVDVVPYVIMWCRYTFFFVLYPLGVLGEQMLLFTALPIVKATGQWNYPLPNQLNISFDFYYFICIFIFLYIPLFPQLYGHMIRQRKKVIGGSKDTRVAGGSARSKKLD